MRSLALYLLEAQRGPRVVDRDERHRPVTLHRGDITEDVALYPPRSRGEVGCADRLAALRIRDPDQPIRFRSGDCAGSKTPQLVDVLDEEQHRVEGLARLNLLPQVAWPWRQKSNV